MEEDNNKEQEEQWQEESKEFGRPEEEIQLYQDWTVPKGTHLIGLDRKKGYKEAVTQDIVTGFLSETQEEICSDYLSLISGVLELSRQTGINLSSAQRYFAMIVNNTANVSKGYEGNLLKVIRTSYQVTEERKARATEKDIEEQEDKRKKPNFDFFAVK